MKEKPKKKKIKTSTKKMNEFKYKMLRNYFGLKSGIFLDCFYASSIDTIILKLLFR